MSHLIKALAWAAVIILVAVASRAGLFGEDMADALMMATLVVWVSTGMPRSCPDRPTQGN